MCTKSDYLTRNFYVRTAMLMLIQFYCFTTATAQNFYSYGGVIPNNSSGNCFSLSVSGVGNLSATNGIVRVCLSIDQARPNDMDITLRSPSGTVVTLSTDNGGSSGNDYYEGLCFSDCGPSGPISSGSNFRGVYDPEGTLGVINNGTSADGTWQLCIDDDNASGTHGTLNYWSLDFGTTVMPATPSGETCANAMILTSLPFSHTCMDLSGSLDDYNSCTGMMEGADYLYRYTPASADEFLSVDIAQDWSVPSGFPTVVFLDTCPDVALAANCIQTEIQFSSTENILHITSQPLTQGKTYYIVAASTSGTGGIYDMRIAMGRNGNDDCLNATVINQPGEYAGNNYAATNPSTQAPNTTEMACNGSIDNFVFYTFTTDATGSPVYVNVTDIDCDLSCGGSCGIQLALFEAPSGGACLGGGTWGSPVYCEASTQSNVYYAWSGLTPNTQYYLMVDGNAGSQCVWNLRVTGGLAMGAPLPVEFASLEVVPEASGNQVSWETSSEINVSHFEVEHATDQHNFDPHIFEPIAMVTATGDAEQGKPYGYHHSGVFAGWHHYRIKSTDLDGQVSYSKVVRVHQAARLAVRLYPNPAREQVSLNSGEAMMSRIVIRDLKGKVVQTHFPEGNVVSLDVSALTAGIYFAAVSMEDGSQEVLKLIRE